MGLKNDDPCLARVDDDEPIFVLRAQDASIIRTIVAWLDLNPALPAAKYRNVLGLIANIRDWQISHQDRVKAAD
jgi:hypothetical protein